MDDLIRVAYKQPSMLARASHLESLLGDLFENRIPGGFDLFQYRKRVLQNEGRFEEIKVATKAANSLSCQDLDNLHVIKAKLVDDQVKIHQTTPFTMMRY